MGQDQFSSDLRTRAQGASADPAARQSFGDHAHRHLAHARPAPGLRRRQAEHAQITQLLQQAKRDQFVAQVPAVCVRGNFLGGERVELVPNRLEGFIQPAGLQRGPPARRVQKFNDPEFHRL